MSLIEPEENRKSRHDTSLLLRQDYQHDPGVCECDYTIQAG